MLSAYHEFCGKLSAGPVFPSLTLAEYEAYFRYFRECYNISGFVPHTARHSGPTDDLLHGRMLSEKVAARGRWVAPKSVRRDTKPSRMLSLSARLSKKFFGRGQAMDMGEKLQRFLESGGRLDAVSNATCQWATVPRSSAIFASSFFRLLLIMGAWRCLWSKLPIVTSEGSFHLRSSACLSSKIKT